MNQNGFISLIALVLIVIVILTAGAYYYGRGSGNVTSENREVGHFSKISLKGVGHLKIEKGDTESLRLEAEDNLINKIKTEVSDGTLNITYKFSWSFWSVWPTRDINMYITVTDLSAVSISGSGSMTLPNAEFTSLDLKIDGSGKITGGQITANRLSIKVNGSGNTDLDLKVTDLASEVSGSGDFSLSGTAGKQSIEISGSGKYLARELNSQQAEVDISGSGRAELSVSDQLDIKISGSGSVYYSGQPKINQSVSGSGTIEMLSD